MKIGYTVGGLDEVEHLKTHGNCDIVIRGKNYKEYREEFEQFLIDYSMYELVVRNVENTGLMILQLGAILEEFCEQINMLTFLEKETDSNEDYMNIIVKMSSRDKNVMRRRTKLGLENARKNGKRSGRPSLGKQTILKIRYLAQQELRGLREVAFLCDVSLGTVHKYATMSDETFKLLTNTFSD
ncbi:recombinase family protein [Vagococcus sp. BWB3-3]|uniref:Recombinase family protein n=1 Tax=Vagococcus allomyrinae TaxID=2794353 RepID=A0A940PIN8_9ENTE|nr:recombinase family protein [Vagococcus allomyrinae]MBP1044286.1 recombinase family protein [Vagococcus allomyrinae]